MEDSELLAECYALSGRGLQGFKLLQRKLQDSSQGTSWERVIHLNNAVMTGNMTIARYLVDVVGVKTLNVARKGYTPLQMAVVWGQLELMVYLLTRGADLMMNTSDSVVDQCRLRQARLQASLDHAAELPGEYFGLDRSQIVSLFENGKVMLEVLEGVQSAGSYYSWACSNRQHQMVKRFSWNLGDAEPRRRLAVLRSLVLAGRAGLRPAAEREEIVAEMQQPIPEEEKSQPLADALAQIGLGIRTREIQDALQACTVAQLQEKRLLREEFEAQLCHVKALTDGEIRRLWRFIIDLQEPMPSKRASTASTRRGAVAPSKVALMCATPTVSKMLPSKDGYAAARTPAPRTPAAKIRHELKADGLELVFHESLPIGAFILVTRCLYGMCLG